MLTHLSDTKTNIQCDANSSIEFLQKALPLSIIDDELCYTDVQGDIHALDTTEAVTAGSLWLCDKLVLPPYDIYHGGNIRKSLEAQNLYVAMNLTKILNDENYSHEFNRVYNGYDFNSFVNNLNKGTFTQLISDWSQDNSIIVNIIISLSKYVIVRGKKRRARYNIGGLTSKEPIGISELKESLKSVMFEYTQPVDLLSASEVKKLTKIELLQAIAKCDMAKEEVIRKSNFSTLWHILKFNSEYLRLSTRKAFKVYALKTITEAVKDLDLDVEEVNTLVTKCCKRLISATVRSMRTEQVKLYLDNKLDYVLSQKS